MIIACLSDKGGTGKTTITHSVAVALEKAGKSICMFDGDNQELTLFWLSQRAKNYGTNIKVKKAYSGESFKDQFLEAAKEFDYVLIDCAGYDNVLMRSALLVADKVIVPTKQSQIDVLSYRQVQKEWMPKAKSINPNVEFYAVLTEASTRMTEYTEIAELKDAVRQFGINMCQHHFSGRKAFKRLFIKGGSWLEVGDKKAEAEVTNLISEIGIM
ncbi:MAG: AAA family ATPase [Enterovibrio sp.]